MAKELLSSDDSDSEGGGADVSTASLQVNEDYARKFEYNKKREEKARCRSPVSYT
jgi:protein KRI1